MKKELLALAQVRYDTVTIEGKDFRVREVGTVEFAEYGVLAGDQKDDNGAVIKKGNRTEATAYLIESCLVDDEGNPLLTKEEAAAVAKSARVAMPIVNKVMELSGFNKEDEEKHSDARPAV